MIRAGLTALALLALAACSAPDGPMDPADKGGPRPETDAGSGGCARSLESVLRTIDDGRPDAIPTWEEIDCWAADAPRAPHPDVVVMVADRPPDEDARGEWRGAWAELQARDAYLDAWPMNQLALASTAMPPYLASDGGSFYRESPEAWDLKLRALAAGGLWVKARGLGAVMAYFYPPSFTDPEKWYRLHAENVHDADSFLAWWREAWIPERVDLARTAERIGAEVLMPWDVEVGQTVRVFGDGWLEALSPAEQVALAQTAADELAAAVRPVFHGTLSVIVHDRYAAVGEQWKDLDLSAWDELRFSLFTEGDLTATERYLDEQLAGVAEIVARSGRPWIAQEISVDGDRHRELLPAGVRFEDIEADVYRMIFAKLRAMPVKPVGVGVTTGFIETPEAEAYVRAELEDIAANGL